MWDGIVMVGVLPHCSVGLEQGILRSEIPRRAHNSHLIPRCGLNEAQGQVVTWILDSL